jgi:hypothetical protein
VTSSSHLPRVRARDYGADAVLLELEGAEPTLFISPEQSLGSALIAVKGCMPHLSDEQIRNLVSQVPGMVELDARMGTIDPTPPRIQAPLPEEPAAPPRPHRPRVAWTRRLAVTAVALPALLAGYAIGAHSQEHTGVTPAASKSDDQPYENPEFQAFSRDGKMRCQTIAPLRAQCTDVDGMSMLAEAAVGPNSVVYTFSYGKETLGLRVFYDAVSARTWADQEGNQRAYPNLAVQDRYALWGTDKSRLGEYHHLLTASANRLGAPAPGPSTNAAAARSEVFPMPMPERLAVLALGTLGVDEYQLSTMATVGKDVPMKLAVDLVLGIANPDMPISIQGANGGDVLAIELPPVVVVPGDSTGTEPAIGTGEATASTPSVPTEPVPGTPSSPPPTEALPSAPPVTTTPTPTPVEPTPSPSPTPADPTPAPEDPAPAPEDPPVSDPVPPAETSTPGDGKQEPPVETPADPGAGDQPPADPAPADPGAPAPLPDPDEPADSNGGQGQPPVETPPVETPADPGTGDDGGDGGQAAPPFAEPPVDVLTPVTLAVGKPWGPAQTQNGGSSR